MKIIMLIIMFFCIVAFFIISQNNLALNDSKNLENFASLYQNWIGRTSEDIGNLAGHITKIGWLPEK